MLDKSQIKIASSAYANPSSTESLDYSESKDTTGSDILAYCAFLLTYPSSAWWHALKEIKTQVGTLPELDSLVDVIAYIEEQPEGDYEDEYVRLFDFSSQTNMYLSSYDSTNAEEQAAKLLVYKDFFLRHGYEVQKELPDYVPALLELCTYLSEADAWPILKHMKSGLQTLRDELAKGRHIQVFIIDTVLQYIEREERNHDE
ncbi:nitrate reductase molybdenum cofactor assembly chaperone [uncultured Veillonella sp.]|uniref:nitrate reductase molybdenum cofactor assembly chaperone n=1 Tax=uncultured Veillonella sp. TaxID=159268 RepID=UPI0025D636D0|nr:molecular chaperone TorD family protein [uncultured Veillonella sp.]MDY3974218.1 molecular chaperone TorD family protein [Veillonella caviae]